MRIVVLFCSAVTIMSVMSGCFWETFSKRITNTRDSALLHLGQSASEDWERRRSNDILSVLDSLGSNRIDSPIIVSAFHFQGVRRSMLVVYWLDEKPQAQTITLHCSDVGNAVLPIPAAYEIDNEKSAKEELVNYSVYSWPVDNLPFFLKEGVETYVSVSNRNGTSSEWCIVHLVKEGKVR